MAQAYTMVQALQAAGQNPTRDGIVEAVETAGATCEGPWFAPFRYSADSHLGISGVQVTRITGGTTQNLTPVLVTDIGDAEIEASERAGRPAGERHPGRAARRLTCSKATLLPCRCSKVALLQRAGGPLPCYLQ